MKSIVVSSARGPIAASYVVAVAISLMLLASFGAAAASATVENPYIGTLNGPNFGAFGEPTGLAVNSTTGDIWVADNANHVVDEFNPAGSEIIATLTGPSLGEDFHEPHAVAVDDATEEVWVVDEGTKTVYGFDPDGALLTTITGPKTGQAFSEPPDSVAVNQATGDVYVVEEGGHAYEFTAAGAPASAPPGPGPFTEARDLAVNSATGEIYLAKHEGPSGVLGFNAKGEQVSTLTEWSSGSFSGPVAVTVNDEAGSKEQLFVADRPNEAVYGFNAADELVSKITSPVSGSSWNPKAVAIDSTTGYVYVADLETGKVDIFGELAAYPDVTTEAATSLHEGTATLNGKINPEGQSITSCKFEYGPTTAYESTFPCTASGTGEVSVSASVSGLKDDVTYHYRLVAGNSNGTDEGADVTFSIPTPVIESTSTRSLTEKSVVLGATIDPNGSPTTYYFEYGTSTSYGHKAPATPAALPAGTSGQFVSEEVQGLEAGVTYHFRVVAKNSAGIEEGADHTFVYLPPTSTLPDGRAYELVTPPEHGAVIGGLSQTIASNGTSIDGISLAAFGGVSDGEAPIPGQLIYQFDRTPSGWTTRPLSCCGRALGTLGPEYTTWLTGFDGPEIGRIYTDGSSGEMQELGPIWSPELGPQPNGQVSIAATAVNPRYGVAFQEKSPTLLWPGDDSVLSSTEGGNESSVYEYSEATQSAGGAGPAGLVAVNNEGHLIGECSASVGWAAGVSLSEESRYNAMSADGRTLYFTVNAGNKHLSPYTTSECEGTERDGAPATGIAPPTFELYARLDSSHTVWVSEPECVRTLPTCENVDTDKYETAAEAKAAAVVFEGASEDGSKVFFTTTQQIASSDTDATRDLYEYNFDAAEGKPRLTQVSIGGAGDTTPGAGAEVQGVTRISEDGSHVYFVARGVLATGHNSEGQAAEAGADNLYVYEPKPGVGGVYQTVFIAKLCSKPEASGRVADPQCPATINELPPQYDGVVATNEVGSLNDQNLWAHPQEFGDRNRPVQATPNGETLVFTSYADLTRGDTSAARQVFAYDAASNTLTRISAGEHGYNDDGNEGQTGSADAAIVITQYNQGVAGGIARTMSDNGEYIFFQSPVGLTPTALDRVPIDAHGDLAQNVYEYHDGTVSLISDGKDTAFVPRSNRAHYQGSAVALLGTDASGENVFFTTTDALVPQDTNTALDIYDARIGGGFPAPAEQTFCETGCQGAPPAAPVFAAPASATLSGAGNIPPPAAAKPAVKAKPLTRAQKLANALKACRKQAKRKRAVCERRARRSFASKTKKSKTSDRRGR